MPDYLYRCLKCDEEMTISQKMDDPPIDFHWGNWDAGNGPTCGGEIVRVFTPPNINVRTGQSNVLVERNESGETNSVTTQHWDGRQDVVVTPHVVEMKMNPEMDSATTKPVIDDI